VGRGMEDGKEGQLVEVVAARVCQHRPISGSDWGTGAQTGGRCVCLRQCENCSCSSQQYE
jgi:hypothetical protein